MVTGEVERGRGIKQRSRHVCTMFGEIADVHCRSAKGFAAGIQMSQTKLAAWCKHTAIRLLSPPVLFFLRCLILVLCKQKSAVSSY